MVIASDLFRTRNRSPIAIAFRLKYACCGNKMLNLETEYDKMEMLHGENGKKFFENDPSRTRTCNPRLRGPMPSP